MEKMILAEMPLASSCDTETLDFDTLVYTHGRFVLNIAYSVLRNSEDAEDLVQETFFRAFRSGDLGKVTHIRAWLGRIAWKLVACGHPPIQPMASIGKIRENDSRK
jgi:DNA-directed RNA polymerase specialized sigma24 family protein